MPREMKSFGSVVLAGILACLLAHAEEQPNAEGKNAPPSVEQIKKAADEGGADAQFKLGSMYYNGEGVAKDYTASVKWFHEAARQGHAKAQFKLGQMFQQGQGVPQDYGRAHKWFNLAATGGDPKAAEARDALARLMTPQQLADAQRQAALFVARRANDQGKPPAPKASSSEAGAAKTSGTGFFITSDGYLLTSFHVVKGAAEVKIKTPSGLLAAKLVHSDPANDLAILKAAGDFKPLAFGSSRSLKLGDSVFTVGFPNPGLQGFEPKFTKGEISSLAGIKDDPRHLQISVAVQPGNSGGALVDQEGNVVGVIERRLQDMKTLQISGALPQNVNYALKSAYVAAFLESIPEVAAHLKAPGPASARKFDQVILGVQESTALVLAY